MTKDAPGLGTISPPENLTEEEQVYFAPPTEGGRFANPWGVNPNPGVSGVMKWKLRRNVFADEKRKSPNLPVASHPKEFVRAVPSNLRAQWLGHASFLLEVDGVRAIVDPLFGRVAGVLPRAVDAPLRPEDVGPVDAVLLTHGHHDHYDPRSVEAMLSLSGDRALCLVPKGMPVPASPRVVEFSWWQTLRVNSVEFVFVPSQHWHARGPLDRNRALWGGWVLRGTRSVYHSGDTGFFPGFGTIGKALDGVELAILPVGAYEPRWFMGEQHMPPDDSVRAWELLRAKYFLGMHWGTFDLSDEPLDHGPRILRKNLEERALPQERFFVVGHGGGVGVDERGSALAHGAIVF